MSTWGIGLYDNDTSLEVKEFYLQCLRQKKFAFDAEMKLFEHFSFAMEDDDEYINIILALSDVEWDYGRLSMDVKNKALEIISRGADVDNWKLIDEVLSKRRQAVLNKLQIKLLSPQPKEKKVRTPSIFRCEWKIGDVYAIQMESDCSKQHGLYDNWLLLQKVNESDNLKNGISPVVTLRFSRTIKDSLPALLENPCIRVNRYLGYKWSYRLHLLIYSKKSISNFRFLGNNDLVLPTDEYPHSNNTGYKVCAIKFLEEIAIMDSLELGYEKTNNI